MFRINIYLAENVIIFYPKTALTGVALMHCWIGFDWGFLIFLANLQTIPNELYEAARVDGANAWQSFKHITVPLMIQVIVLVEIKCNYFPINLYSIIRNVKITCTLFRTKVGRLYSYLAYLSGVNRLLKYTEDK